MNTVSYNWFRPKMSQFGPTFSDITKDNSETKVGIAISTVYLKCTALATAYAPTTDSVTPKMRIFTVTIAPFVPGPPILACREL